MSSLAWNSLLLSSVAVTSTDIVPLVPGSGVPQKVLLEALKRSQPGMTLPPEWYVCLPMGRPVQARLALYLSVPVVLALPKILVGMV